MKRPVAAGPVIVERQAIEARNPVNDESAPELGRDLEAAGKDNAVDFIFDSIGDDPRLGDPFDTFGRRHIDLRDIRAVEGRQIFVVEPRPLAQESVVRLPGLSRLVFDDAHRRGSAAAYGLALSLFSASESNAVFDR
jgi:hypothetical protein